jgi:hypothetical protein
MKTVPFTLSILLALPLLGAACVPADVMLVELERQRAIMAYYWTVATPFYMFGILVIALILILIFSRRGT